MFKLDNNIALKGPLKPHTDNDNKKSNLKPINVPTHKQDIAKVYNNLLASGKDKEENNFSLEVKSPTEQKNIKDETYKKYAHIKNLIELEERKLVELQKNQIRKKRELSIKQKELETQENVFNKENSRINKLKIQHDKLKEKLLILEVFSEDDSVDFSMRKPTETEPETYTPIKEKTVFQTEFVRQEEKPKVVENFDTVAETVPEFIHKQPKYNYVNMLNLYIMLSVMAITFIMVFLFTVNFDSVDETLLNNEVVINSNNSKIKSIETELSDAPIDENINEVVALPLGENLENEEDIILFDDVEKVEVYDEVIINNSTSNNDHDNSNLINQAYSVSKNIEVGFYAVLGTFSNAQNAEKFKKNKSYSFQTVIIGGRNYKVCKHVSGSDEAIKQELKEYPESWLLYNKGL